ncbi:HPP family protein [bacterium]|nr:HPP family protein [bacterium]MBU1065224.1 HPP family protein [bacterium]MBU1634711.1 HPP family protein [bacterium]MBU1873826.1 HPP family protein [bacterium]
MKIVDPKVADALKEYIFQSVLATISIFLVLIFLDILEHTAIIATLGASAFIIFIMPNSYISLPKQVLGGYIVGIICGWLCFFLMTGFIYFLSFIPEKVFVVSFGSLAVGTAIFLMAVIDFEHPPAVGVSLGLVLNQWNHQTIIFIIFALIIMLVVKKLLQPVLIDLI